MSYRAAPPDSRVELSDEHRRVLLGGAATVELDTLISDVARVVDHAPYGVVFRIGRLRRSMDESREIAIRIAERLGDALIRHGAPSGLRVELDRAQDSFVVDGCASRTLLPHHDSAHCSYLSPSLYLDPEWDPDMRRFSGSGITTTHTIKLYQGFFVNDPGELVSLTSFYDKVRLVRDAHARATGTSRPQLSDTARWMGVNIRDTWTVREEEKVRYLALAAALGARDPIFRYVPVHWAEADFSREQRERFPGLERFRRPTHGLAGPSERLIDAAFRETLGLSWAEVREQHELCVASEAFDLVVGHNLTNLHGGLRGGPSRCLEPICLVVGEAEGDEYEGWLSAAWRAHWDALDEMVLTRNLGTRD